MTLSQLLVLTAIAGGFALLFSLIFWFRQQQRHQKNELLLQRFEELETLSRVSRSIGKTKLDPSALAALIADEAGQIINTRNFQVGLFDGARCKLLYATQNDTPVKHPPAVLLDKPNGAIAYVRNHMETIHIDELAQHEPKLVIETASKLVPRSALLIPLLSNEEAIGVIAALSERAGFYDISQVNRLEVVANQAASALSNALLYEEERRLASDMVLVSEIARQVNALGDPDKIIRQVGDFAHKQLNLHLVMIHEADEISNGTTMKYSSHPDFKQGLYVESLGDGLIGAAIRERKMVVVNDVTKDDRYIPGLGLLGYEDIAERTTSEVVIPLLARNELLGVIDFQNDDPNGFSPRELRVLEALSQEVAGALDRAREAAARSEQAWMTRAQLEIARTITEYAGIDGMLDAATNLIRMLTGANRCGVLLKDEMAAVFRPNTIHGTTNAERNRFLNQTINAGEWGTLDAAVIGQQKRIASADQPWFPVNANPKIELYPLVAGGQVHGVFICEPNAQTRLTPRQVELREELLTSTIRQLSRRIERTRLREAQQAEAWTNVALLQVAQSMNSLTNLKQILDTVVRLVPMLIGVEFCFLLVNDEEDDALVPSASFGLNDAARQLLVNLNDNRLDEQLRIQSEPVNSSSGVDLYIEQLPPQFAKALGTQHVQAIPLRALNSIVGVLAIGPSVLDQPLSGRRFGLLAGIAQQAAIAVVNDQLFAESAETERLQQEVSVALSIQASLIPDGKPDIPGLTVASHWEAAREVSGDFYDFMPLDNNRWAIIIADVAGKGVPAALFMALTRTILRSVGFARTNPAETLLRTNEIILNDTHSDLFVTVFYAVWDPTSGVLRYANGGHNRPFLLRSNGEVNELGEYGMALGIIKEMPLTVQEVTLAENDTVVFYTDGITEAMNGNGDTLGHQAIATLLHEKQPATPTSTIHTILERVTQHSAGVRQSDDMTMVVVRRQADEKPIIQLP